MWLSALLGTVGAGLGLSMGLVFNVRLAQHARHPVLASLVNFLVAFVLTSVLALLGILGTAHLPSHAPLWAFGGGLVGAAYVTLTLFTARALGVAASTAGVTLGQILGARVIDVFGLLGQHIRPVSSAALIGVVLLFLAVALLARERARVST
ncbi:DMT family transporter [Deinococcus altitudinis]|uniref:DMT family transporter n=1 Tax=Deinococcus altitudinis TaxID=468914 RepID=UPI003892C141